jgi:hypothetical protein
MDEGAPARVCMEKIVRWIGLNPEQKRRMFAEALFKK